MGELMPVSSWSLAWSYAAFNQPRSRPATRQTHGRMLENEKAGKATRKHADERAGWDRGANRGKTDRAEANHCGRGILHRRADFGLAARGARRVRLFPRRRGGLYPRRQARA